MHHRNRHSTIRVGGNVRIRVLDAVTNELIETHLTHNMIVTTGLEKIMHLMAYPDLDGEGQTPNYIAAGTDGTDTDADMTSLISEVFRKEITNRYEDTKISFQYYLYLDPSEANGNTLREVGLFSESIGGDLWARATHLDIIKTSSIAVTYEWKFAFAES